MSERDAVFPELIDYRNSRIRKLAFAAQAIAAKATLKPEQGALATAVFTAELQQVEALVATITTSNPGFAERDLPGDVSLSLKNARHWIKVLERLYGPQEG